MKKKILFMAINMNVGGTEKALLNMISELPRDKYDITILMLEKYGGFLDSIPPDVEVRYVKNYKKIKDMLEKPIHFLALESLKEVKLFKAFYLLYIYLLCKIMRENSYYLKFILHDYPIEKNEYDVAVAYAGPMDFISYFVINKIKAKKKIQWIHFDITKIGFNKFFVAKIYKKFNKIFVVSEEGKNKLIKLLPNLTMNTDVFRNIVSREQILKQAKEGSGFTDNFDGTRILTVGRLSHEKGQDIAIKVLLKLIKEGYKVKWYCLGEGHLRPQLEEIIAKSNLQDNFILLGAFPNPYPYIDQCDIYVQPSRHEGYCITLAEAKYLHKPIITTNFTGSKEHIRNSITGSIVSVDEVEIYRALKELLENKHLARKYSENLALENSKDLNKQFNFSI